MATSDNAIAKISLQIKSSEHLLQIEPRFTLLDVLREYIHLSGTKKGCDQRQCCACSVHVGGRRVLGCLTFACQVEGHKITTIEGLAAARYVCSSQRLPVRLLYPRSYHVGSRLRRRKICRSDANILE
jgi:aerobic-type carbon monoxide dehydrogenase small subunit (CoxS/CutS family)